MPARPRLPPAGCKMNDAGYPFRGEHRLPPPLNHGHGAPPPDRRGPPTSLLLHISGANLAIERLQPARGQTLQCELSVGGGASKVVDFPTGAEAAPVPVPGDGREYHLTSIIQGSGGVKHYCKMILNGSEGKSILRLRAPQEARLRDCINLKVDGKRLVPEGGWYLIPIQAKECSLEVRGKEIENYFNPIRDSLQSTAAPLQFQSTQTGVSNVLPSTIIVQTTYGVQDNAVLFCTGSGEALHLIPNKPISIAVDSGPFIFQLPRIPIVQPHIPLGNFKSSYTEPTNSEISPITNNTLHRFPELETKIISSPYDTLSLPIFVAVAEGFMIELIGDDGASASGYGNVQLRLPDRMQHQIRIIITDTSGNIFLRQNTMIPQTENPPLNFSITEDVNGKQIIKGKPNSQISVDNFPSISGEFGVPLESDKSHIVVIRDSGSSANIEIGPHRIISNPIPIQIEKTPETTSTIIPPLPHPPPHSTSSLTFGVEPWIEQLAKALQSPDLDNARRGIQNIIPPNKEASTIIGFISDQLFKTPPTISFIKTNDTLKNIQCLGYSVTVAVDNETPCIITEERGIYVPSGHNVTISAITPSMGRIVASCCIQCLPLEKNLDELLVARLLDTFQRHNNDPEKAALELSNITSSQSSNGNCLISLLVECLRRFSDIYKRCIYLSAFDILENTKLNITIDDQRTIELLSGSSIEIPINIKNIKISTRGIIKESSLQIKSNKNELAKALVGAFYRQSPQTLSERWSLIQTQGSEERALIDLLLQLLRDHENEIAKQRSQGVSSSFSSIDVIQFTCAGGCLKNIRTERPCKLSVDIDGTGFMNLEQGGQVPQGYTFPSNSLHRIHIIARDPISGIPCAETQVILTGGESNNNSEGISSRPLTQLTSSSCFLDVNLSQVVEEIHLRLICPPRLRILCDIDGGNINDTGKSEFTAKMKASRIHNVNVKLINDMGNIVFEQKFTLPAIMSPLWSIGLENESIKVDNINNNNNNNNNNESGTIITASLDRSPERDISGSMYFDSNESHIILLRKYFTGIERWNSCAGELSLRIPAFVNPIYIQEISRLYRGLKLGGGEEELKSRLSELRSRISSNAVKELISALIDFIAPVTHNLRSSRSSSETRVHFRLSGNESLSFRQ